MAGEVVDGPFDIAPQSRAGVFECRAPAEVARQQMHAAAAQLGRARLRNNRLAAD